MAEPNIKLDINPRFMGFFFWISLFKHFRDHKNRFTTDLQPIYNQIRLDINPLYNRIKLDINPRFMGFFSLNISI